MHKAGMMHVRATLRQSSDTSVYSSAQRDQQELLDWVRSWPASCMARRIAAGLDITTLSGHVWEHKLPRLGRALCRSGCPVCILCCNLAALLESQRTLSADLVVQYKNNHHQHHKRPSLLPPPPSLLPAERPCYHRPQAIQHYTDDRNRLKKQERKEAVLRPLAVGEEALLARIRQRIDRCGYRLPGVRVSYHDVSVVRRAVPASAGHPTVLTPITSLFQRPSGHTVAALDGITGVLECARSRFFCNFFLHFCYVRDELYAIQPLQHPSIHPCRLLCSVYLL
jgi:hypothetical protein